MFTSLLFCFISCILPVFLIYLTLDYHSGCDSDDCDNDGYDNDDCDSDCNSMLWSHCGSRALKESDKEM